MGGPDYANMLPPQGRRFERAMRANDTVRNIIPELLRSCPRARHGIHLANRVDNPPVFESTSDFPSSTSKPLNIRIQCADTLSAAARMSTRPFATRQPRSDIGRRQPQKPNVAVLNMASATRPGGGFLDGANSQEEFLCARTTLYASLWDSFYPLPEYGGVFSPDILVYRDQSPDATDLSKADRFFVDVISASMLKFPGSERARHDETDRDPSCTCGINFCDGHRNTVMRKMKAVLRLAQHHGVESLVLGAWGCGAYDNPVPEIARLWRRVLVGGARQNQTKKERWSGIRNVTFAIPDRAAAVEFEAVFSDILSTTASAQKVDVASNKLGGPVANASRATTSELMDRIMLTEMEFEQTHNSRTRARLRAVIDDLKEELNRSLMVQPSRDEYTLPQDEEHDHDENSDHDNDLYFDENDIASSCSDFDSSEIFSFPRRQRSSSITSHDSHDADDRNLQDLHAALPPSPNFDASTGWFSGSIDEFHKYMKGTDSKLQSYSSPQTPGIEGEISGLGLEEGKIQRYLNKYVDDGEEF